MGPSTAADATATAALDAWTMAAIAALPVWLPARVVAFHAPGPWPPAVAYPASATLTVDQLYARPLAARADAEAWETPRQTAEGWEAVGRYGVNAANPAGTIRVPVFYPGADDGKVRAPLNPGQTGILILSSRSVQRWLQGDRGPGAGPPDPVASLAPLVDLAAGVFLPGQPVGAAALLEAGAFAPGVQLTLGDAAGLTQIKLTAGGVWDITGTQINLGGPGALPIAVNLQVLAVLQALNAQLQADPLVDPNLKIAFGAWASTLVAALPGAFVGRTV